MRFDANFRFKRSLKGETGKCFETTLSDLFLNQKIHKKCLLYLRVIILVLLFLIKENKTKRLFRITMDNYSK